MPYLSVPINASTGSIRVNVGIANPAYPILYTLDSETVKVVSGADTTTWIVERGIGDSSATSHIGWTDD